MKTTLLPLLVILSACVRPIGPDYQRPEITTQTYRNIQFRTPNPQATITRESRGWERFKDSKLQLLLKQFKADNIDLKQAWLTYQQSKDMYRQQRSDLFPMLGINQTVENQRTSENMPSPFPINGFTYQGGSFLSTLDTAWELDLWGKLRRQLESKKAISKAKQAQLSQLTLSLEAELITQYFNLCALKQDKDIHQVLLQQQQNLQQIIQNKVQVGSSTELELSQSNIEIAKIKAEQHQLNQQEDFLENQISLLLSQNVSSTKKLLTASRLPSIPYTPIGIQSDLLERRPDLAEAEQQLIAANALIGVAKAQFFPSIRLIGSIGYLSGDLKQLFEPNSLIWNVGPRVNIPLFAAGKSIFNLRNTKNEVQIARLQYQKTFLKAVSEVENQLSQAHHLKNQAQQITIAEHEQKNAVTILRNQFELGSGNYTELLNGQKELLKLQRLHLQIDLQQVLTQVNLIKALGGGL